MPEIGLDFPIHHFLSHWITTIENMNSYILLLVTSWTIVLNILNNVCPVKIRSKHSSVLLLYLLRIFTGQTLGRF